MGGRKRNIICLETEWSFNKRKFQDKFSSESLLVFLNSYYGTDYIYRRVATSSELEYYLKEFSKKSFDKYEIFYFSFHGERNAISLEGEKDGIINLGKLAEMAGDAFQNKIVHFSSCRTFVGSNTSNEEFKDKTNASIISGYRKSVDVMKSAILDISYFNELQTRKRLGLVKNAMEKQYGDLMEKLGFALY